MLRRSTKEKLHPRNRFREGYDFQQLKGLVAREKLPTETSVRAYNVRDSVVQESNRIFDDAALDVEQKRAAFQALAQATRAQFITTLGPVAGPACRAL